MRVTTLILITAIVAYFVQGFNQPKCEHKFTQVEQDTVKIEQPTPGYSIILPIHSQTTGLHEGKELVCVKCSHVQKQILDYGGERVTLLHFDSTFKSLTACDSILTTSSGGLHFIKGDTLFNTSNYGK